MLSDYMNEDDEYYYNPEIFDDYERGFVMDDDSGITWGDVCDALTNLYQEKGHSGPFNFEEFYQALVDVMIDPALKGLIEKGLLHSYMSRDGEIMYTLTELGQQAASIMMAEESDND